MEDPDTKLLFFFLNFFSDAAFIQPGVIASLITICVLLVCSAFISGAEVAFFSLSPQELDEVRNQNSRSGSTIIKLLDHPKSLLATLLIANNFVNIGIVIVSTLLINQYLFFSSPAVEFLVQVVSVTFLILLVGEVTPKVYATRYAVKFSGFMALPLSFLVTLFRPLSFLLISTTSLVEKLFKKESANISMDELSHALEITSSEQTSESEQKILKGIVKFGSTEARQIMTPRTDVTAFDYSADFKSLISAIVESGFSRVPVYKETIDEIAGVLYIKDLLPYLDEENFEWQKLLRAPFFVPANKKIDDLLKEFQEKKIHLAIVVDEYGGSLGVVTLEDIIEEIVGDINDEFDDDELAYSKLDEHNYIFEGKTPLNDLFRILQVDTEAFEKSRGESDTLAGFILELEGKIPPKNAQIKFENFTFKIESADRRRIKTVKVTIHPEPLLK